MEGRDFSFQGSSNYEDAMKEIDRREGSGKSAAECGNDGSGC